MSEPADGRHFSRDVELPVAIPQGNGGEAAGAEAGLGVDESVVALTNEAAHESRSYIGVAMHQKEKMDTDTSFDDEFDVQGGKRRWRHRKLSPWLWPAAPLLNVYDWLKELSRAFGLPFVIVVIMVYGINQGFAEALQELVSNYYWKDVQKIQPDETQVYSALSKVPWDLKPIYGLITDAFPIAGYRRWPYLALLACLGMISWWLLMLLPSISPAVATLLLAGVAVSTAFPDVVIDAVVAQKTHVKPAFAGDLQSLSWGSLAVGSLVGYGVSGPTVHSAGTAGSFGVLSLTFAAVLGAAWLLPEEKLPAHLRAPSVAAFLKSCRLFLRTITDSKIWRPTLYVFLAHGGICPDIGQGLFFWYTSADNGPKFQENLIGFIYAMGYVGSLGGVVAYNSLFKHYTYRSILFWAQLLVFAAGVLDLVLVTGTNRVLGIPDKVFVIGDRAASDATDRLQLMPMLVLAAQLCPPGIEGTLFAFLMSVSNFGKHVAVWEGALLLHLVGVTRDDYSKLWLAVVFRTAMRLLPIFCLFLLPEGNVETVIAPEIEFEGEKEPGRGSLDSMEDLTVLARGSHDREEEMLLEEEGRSMSSGRTHRLQSH